MRAIKIITICLSLVLGGLSFFIVVKELTHDINAFNKDLTLLIPVGVAVLSIPSIIYNIKSKYERNIFGSTDTSLLDIEFSKSIEFETKYGKVNYHLWILNLIFGLYIFTLGATSLTMCLRSSFTFSSPEEILAYLLTAILLLVGLSTVFFGYRR